MYDRYAMVSVKYLYTWMFIKQILWIVGFGLEPWDMNRPQAAVPDAKDDLERVQARPLHHEIHERL